MKNYQIREIKLAVDEDQALIPEKIARKLGIKKSDVLACKVVRESLDCRKKQAIKKVYTVDFASEKELSLPVAPDNSYQLPKATLDRSSKIVVVGFGPCGIFSALLLAQLGYKPVVLERGHEVDRRQEEVNAFWRGGPLNPESNVQFGEGGAGTFSDGKLTTGINDPLCRKVLTELHRFGGPDDILYKNKPHIGTDLLRGIVKGIRQEIIRLGGQICFSSKLVDLEIDRGKIKSVTVESGSQKYQLACDKLILAMGHSARDLFRTCLDKGLGMEQKAFSIGARIEHPQTLINGAQYGDPALAKLLGAADYKLNCLTEDKRGVYTFCMCPGGRVIVASSTPGQLVSNGMSYHARAGAFANSALLVDVRKTDFASSQPLAGLEFQEKWESLAYQLSTTYKLLETDLKGFASSPLAKALPAFASQSILEALPRLDQKLKGFAGEEARLLGPETRSSSPVRFYRDKNFEANIKGIYPAGEGAGYAGGIMSAAVDGLKVAAAIVGGE